jgi:TfoX/Sxy family transcriptional regulator of competence genes
MEQKRFKSLRESVSIKMFEADDYRVEVRQSFSSYDIFVNDQLVESFKTKEMALEVAEQSIEALKK